MEDQVALLVQQTAVAVIFVYGCLTFSGFRFNRVAGLFGRGGIWGPFVMEQCQLITMAHWLGKVVLDFR
jgi:hypothetical protein